MTSPDDRQPGGSEKVEYTRGGVPKQCPGCRHRFHPAGQCQHEWREYGVENPTEQRCLCDRNMAIRIPEPGGSGAGSTVDLFFMGKPAPEEHDIVAAQRVIAELRAALEAARKIAYLPCDWNHCIGECQCRRDAGRPTTYQAAYEQSRATEAELRNSRGAVAAENGRLRGALREIADGTHPLEMVRVARRALDATERPARAEGGQDWRALPGG